TETLEEAARARPTERLAGLRPEEIFAAKLNRAGHYMKPRLNGRTLTEGWFDTQLLYKIPRTPQTMGLRSFGRLAFCDHYRPLMGRIHTELDACLSLDSLHLTEQRTSLRRRTNRPRVYIVAGIAGGTGGGMFLDAAYAVRTRMKRMGYENPDVVGVLIVPPADAMLTPPQALGNTYAALTELNHFSRPQSTFVAHYDERQGQIREKQAPFSRWYLLPGSLAGLNLPKNGPPPAGSGAIPPPRSKTPTAISAPAARLRPSLPPGSGSMQKPGSRVIPCIPIRTEDSTQTSLRPYTDAAELLRLELFTALGHAADELRKARIENDPSPGVKFAAFGVTAFDWPRAEVVSRTAAAAARNVLKNWLAPNLKRAREVVPTWAAARWTQFGLDPEAILAHLQQAMELAVGGKVEELIALTTEPLVPRGWLARLPEPEKIQVAVDRLVKLLGPPISVAKRELTIGEAAVHNAALTAAEGFTVELSVLGHSLVEDPEFRLAGAEEVLRQFLATTDRLMTSYVDDANQAEAKAQTGFECLVQYMHFQKGMRKPAAGEMADALRQFPRARYQAFTYRELAGVYKAIREVLAGQLADVADARQRMETAAAVVEPEPIDVIPGPRRLMPPGCLGVTDAVQRFLAVINDDDLAEIDRRLHTALEPELGGLFQACFDSSTGGEGVVRVLREEARSYLDGRLGEVDLGAMFAERFRSKQLAEQGVGQAFADAEPEWVANGPWASTEMVAASSPGGQAGIPVRELLVRAVPVAGLVIAESRDDLTIYRELPLVPISAVPHLGPAGATAYQNLPETLQCSLHTRLDVTAWTDVDAD
ncbi:MAG TPA: tubulin-like doman-containing protein, partial [Gemmataceae bacterium]